MAEFPGWMAKFDDPARLGGTVHLTVTNGFTLRWVAKSAKDGGNCDVFFVHGSPGGAGVWAAQFNPPFSGANQYAYDRPGFGGSLPRWRQPHVQDQAEALATLISVVTTNRVYLVGHSYGSPVALCAALAHPEKVAGVLLIGGDVDPAMEQPWLIQRIFGWRLTSWLVPRSLRQCNREMLTARQDLELMRAQIPTLAVPVVMLHGDHDPLVPVSNVAWLENELVRVGKARLFAKIILPGVNHFIPWEHPDQVVRAFQQLRQMSGTELREKLHSGG